MDAELRQSLEEMEGRINKRIDDLQGHVNQRLNLLGDVISNLRVELLDEIRKVRQDF